MDLHWECPFNNIQKDISCNVPECKLTPSAKATPMVWSLHQHIHEPGWSLEMEFSQHFLKPTQFAYLGFQWKFSHTPVCPPTPNPAHPRSIFTQQNLFSAHLLAVKLHSPDCILCLAIASLYTTQMLANYVSGRALQIWIIKPLCCSDLSTCNCWQASRLPTSHMNTANYPSEPFHT